VAGDELDHVWRPGRWSRVGAWAVGSVGAVLVFGLFPGVAWRWGTHPLLGASDDGVLVRNPVRVVTVPWADVERVVPSSLGLIIERRRGQPVVAWAVGKSNVSRWLRRRTRADAVAATLEQRAAASQQS
jgi:hypothetical protein